MASSALVRLALVTAAVLSAELLLGAALVAVVAAVLGRLGTGAGGRRRRWVAIWSRGARRLARMAPATAAALVAALAAIALGGGPPSLADAPWFRPVGFVALGALPTAAYALLLRAGRLYGRGRLRAAVSGGRLAGELAFLGSVALVLLVWSDLLYRVDVRRAVVGSTAGAGLLVVGGTVAVGCGAFVAVTSGLAAKPRPGGTIAALCYALGSAAWILAHHLATR